MSGTRSSSSHPRADADAGEPGIAGRVPPWVLDAGLAAFGVLFLALMLLWPDYQAIPYHLLYVSIIIVYGFRVWSLVPTVVVVLAVFVVTGAVEVVHFVQHVSPSPHAGHAAGAAASPIPDGVGELFEVLLMPAILIATVWSVRRRDAAERRMHEIAVRESDVRQAETQFLREAAHALRNPVAVARGWLDLADQREDARGRGDAETRDRVRGELARIDRMALELLDVAAHPDSTADRTSPSDLAHVASDAMDRWRTTAARTWVLDVDDEAIADVDVDRVSDALDAIIDNALRFTTTSDQVRVICRSAPSGIVLAVADSGCGIAPADRDRVFDRFWRGERPDGSRGTGLGLAMVAVVADQFGGRAFAGPAPEGGALVGIVLPQDVPALDAHRDHGAGGTSVGEGTARESRHGVGLDPAPTRSF